MNIMLAFQLVVPIIGSIVAGPANSFAIIKLWVKSVKLLFEHLCKMFS